MSARIISDRSDRLQANSGKFSIGEKRSSEMRTAGDAGRASNVASRRDEIVGVQALACG
jgi:hypothetical protein